MKSEKTLAIVILISALAMGGYFLWKNRDPKRTPGDPRNDNNNGSNSSGSGGGQSGGENWQVTPWADINVGDTIFAVEQTNVYDKNPASGGKVLFSVMPGGYIGTVNTKGNLALTIKNMGKLGVYKLGFVFGKKIRKG